MLNTNKIVINNSYNLLFDNYEYFNTYKLSIPKINFYKTFTKYSSLDDSIKLHEKSILPNGDKSTIIILGHSGYAHNAFFNNLVFLEIGDNINFSYANKTYSYEVQNIEYINKGFSYKVKFNENNLYLITCSLTDFSKQIVINSKKI